MTATLRKIREAFERDTVSGREPVGAEDLPLSYESITDQWLTAVLCPAVPGAAVTAHRLSKPDNGSSNRRKIYLDLNETGRAAGLPDAVFCKASLSLANRVILGLAGGAHAEALFYNDIRPLLDIEAPTGYFARVDPETYNSMIMLEDLTESVMEFCDQTTVMTRARAESQLRLLGRVHGACYGNATLRSRLVKFNTWRQYFNQTLGFGMREGSNAGFVASKDVIPARLYGRYDEIWPAAAGAVDEADRLPATLAHGDVHLKNWYVAGNGEMGISDWQCATRGHWGRDFAYTISTALTVENRRAWERDLLAYYLDQMASSGGPTIGFDVAWNTYRLQLNPALTWWTVTLTPPPGMPDMQPPETTLEFIRRIATAMDDLDALDAM